MKFKVDFQYRARGKTRPSDEGEVCPIDVGEAAAVIPTVGDYVNIVEHKGTVFRGVVASRLFSFFPDADTCAVNIVVDKSDVDWSSLIKE